MYRQIIRQATVKYNNVQAEVKTATLCLVSRLKAKPHNVGADKGQRVTYGLITVFTDSTCSMYQTLNQIMIKRLFLLLLLPALLSGCVSGKKGSTNSSTGTGFTASTPRSTDDGLSFPTAIVITEKTSTKGIPAEYKWIKEHYSDYQVERQSLRFQNNKPYDVITIAFPDGRKLDLHFDISNFYGRF